MVDAGSLDQAIDQSIKLFFHSYPGSKYAIQSRLRYCIIIYISVKNTHRAIVE